MGKMRIVLAGLLVVALMLGATGCSEVEKHPSNYETLSSLIGLSLEDACTQLGLEKDELTEVSKGMYSLPESATYAGATFTVRLRINLLEGLISGICYEAVYENNPETAAKDVAAVAKALSKAMGKTYVKKETVISDIKEGKLATAFSGEEKFTENNFWDLTESSGDAVKAYLKYLATTPGWEPYAQQGDPHFYLDFDVFYIPNQETVGVTLTYAAEAYRGDGNYEEVEGGIVQ